jgi:hypothetical protein
VAAETVAVITVVNAAAVTTTAAAAVTAIAAVANTIVTVIVAISTAVAANDIGNGGIVTLMGWLWVVA